MSVNYINAINDTSSPSVKYYLYEGVDTRIFRATCESTADTISKIATLDDATNYTLAAGVRVAVTFKYGNTQPSPTLNVNNGGAKAILMPASATTTAAANGNTYGSWGAYETVIFTYNGTSWIKGPSGLGLYNAYDLAAEAKSACDSSLTLLISGSSSNGYLTMLESQDTSDTCSLVDYDAIGANGGVAPLNSSGKLATSYLPLKSNNAASNDSETISNTANRQYAVVKDASGYLSVNVPWTGEGGGGTSERNTFYGTCSTTASTAAKAVTATGFIFSAGNILGVMFSKANTAATPTLNVNSAGAKAIYVGGTAALNATTNVLKWSANTMIYFMYDGTYFRYMNAVSAANVAQPRGTNTWYGTCSTAEATTAKASTIDNYVLATGSLVVVNFTYAVPASSTLNINSTGAKNIYYRGASIAANIIRAGDTATFIYNGTQYSLLAIDKAANDVDSSYIEFPNGTVMQIGATSLTFTSANYVDVTTNLTTAMPSDGYKVFYSMSNSGTTQAVHGATAVTNSKTASSFVTRVWKNGSSTSEGSTYFAWMIIGS